MLNTCFVHSAPIPLNINASIILRMCLHTYAPDWLHILRFRVNFEAVARRCRCIWLSSGTVPDVITAEDTDSG